MGQDVGLWYLRPPAIGIGCHPLAQGRVDACATDDRRERRRARVTLSFLARPGDLVLGTALRTRTATEVLAPVTGADADSAAVLAGQEEDATLSRVVQRWRDRLGEIPSTAMLAAGRTAGCAGVADGQLSTAPNVAPLVVHIRRRGSAAGRRISQGRDRRWSR